MDIVCITDNGNYTQAQREALQPVINIIKKIWNTIKTKVLSWIDYFKGAHKNANRFNALIPKQLPANNFKAPSQVMDNRPMSINARCTI